MENLQESLWYLPCINRGFDDDGDEWRKAFGFVLLRFCKDNVVISRYIESLDKPNLSTISLNADDPLTVVWRGNYQIEAPHIEFDLRRVRDDFWEIRAVNWKYWGYAFPSWDARSLAVDCGQRCYIGTIQPGEIHIPLADPGLPREGFDYGELVFYEHAGASGEDDLAKTRFDYLEHVADRRDRKDGRM